MKKLGLAEEIDYDKVEKELIRKARIIREASKDKLLFEAGQRRAFNLYVANMASKIALEEGWDGTSATQLIFDGEKRIGGTMAHSYIMSYEKEVESYFDFIDIYGEETTILGDTNGIENGIKIVKDYNIKCKDIRCDSGDLKKFLKDIKNTFKGKIKAYPSGDLDENIIDELMKDENSDVINKFMVGAKFVNVGGLEKYNCGFVYKIVEYQKNGEMFYPEKKAEGKLNYPSLKQLINIGDKLVIKKLYNNKLDLSSFKLTEDMIINNKIIFDGGFK